CVARMARASVKAPVSTPPKRIGMRGPRWRGSRCARISSRKETPTGPSPMPRMAQIAKSKISPGEVATATATRSAPPSARCDTTCRIFGREREDLSEPEEFSAAERRSRVDMRRGGARRAKLPETQEFEAERGNEGGDCASRSQCGGK